MKKTIVTLVITVLSLAPLVTHGDIFSDSVSQGSDDAQTCTMGCSFSNSANSLLLGMGIDPGGGPPIYIAWLRYDNVTIEEDATISGAIITFTSSTTVTSSDCDVRIRAIDENDTATFSTDPSARSVTTLYTDWNNLSGWSTDETYMTPDISNPIQEVINESYWESGEALGFRLENNGVSPSNFRSAYSYDGSSGDAALLTITYSESGGVPEFSTYTMFMTIILSIFAIMFVKRYAMVKVPKRNNKKKKLFH